MKEEEFYLKEIKLIKDKLHETKMKINENRQETKNCRDEEETLLVDTVLTTHNLKENNQKIILLKQKLVKLDESFKDLKCIVKGLELREKVFQSILNEQL